MRGSIAAFVRTLIFEKNEVADFKVAGSSMYPSLCEGDIVEVRPVKKGSIPKVGTCVVVLYRGELVVHRVVTYINTHVITAGDNSFIAEKCNVTDIIGYVHLNEPSTKRLVIVLLNILVFKFSNAMFLVVIRRKIVRVLTKVVSI